MSASLFLPNGVQTVNNQPEISRYYNLSGHPYTTTTQVIIEVTGRYVGQTFNVNGVEYWFKDGILDTDLVIKIAKNQDSTTNVNLSFYATTAPSDVIGYNKIVTSIGDVDYNTPAVDVNTGQILTTEQLISELVSTNNLIEGNPGVINVTTVGEIRKISGSGNAEFFFKVFKRDIDDVETLVAVSNKTTTVTANVYQQFQVSALFINGEWVASDRVVIKFYADRIAGGSNPEYQFLFGGTNPVRTLFPVAASLLLNVPISVGITDVKNATTGKLLSTDANEKLTETGVVSKVVYCTLLDVGATDPNQPDIDDLVKAWVVSQNITKLPNEEYIFVLENSIKTYKLVDFESGLLNSSIVLSKISEEIPFTPSDYDLDEFTNESADPFVRASGVPPGETTASIQAKRPLKTVNSQSLEGSGNVQVGTVLGSGTANTLPVFTPDGNTLGNSRIVQFTGVNVGETRVTNPVEPTMGVSFHPIVFVIFRLFRNQSRIDFSLGNPDTSVENIISTHNYFGTAISSSGYLRFLVNQTTSQTAGGVTESLRLLPTGQIQITQTPVTGTTADALLVRNADGSVRQIPTSAVGGAVSSVNGQTGVVVLNKSDVGLSNVDNTSDLSKPISTATQTALNAKQNTLIAGANITIIGDTISASGSGGGATNLSYTPSPTNGTVASDTGTDATIPLATGTNAGLLSPSEKVAIGRIPVQVMGFDYAAFSSFSSNFYNLEIGTYEYYYKLSENVSATTNINLVSADDKSYFDQVTQNCVLKKISFNADVLFGFQFNYEVGIYKSDDIFGTNAVLIYNQTFTADADFLLKAKENLNITVEQDKFIHLFFRCTDNNQQGNTVRDFKLEFYA